MMIIAYNSPVIQLKMKTGGFLLRLSVIAVCSTASNPPYTPERIHPRNIPQHAFEPYNVDGGQPSPPVYLKQCFFLHLFSVGGVILPAGQVAEKEKARKSQ